MSISSYTENAAHRAAILAAESTRQAAVSGSGGNPATVRAAEIAFHTAVLASAKLNIGNFGSVASAEQALMDLGNGAV